MRYIRINNDVKIKWEILRNTDPEVFTSKNVTVKLFSKCGCEQNITYNIVDNIVFIDFFGKDQHETGTYRLCLIENDGEPNMATLDYVDAFTLSKTLKNQTSSGTDSSSNITTEVIELSSKINTTGVEYIGGDGIDVIGTVISVDDTVARTEDLEALEAKIDGKDVIISGEVEAEKQERIAADNALEELINTNKGKFDDFTTIYNNGVHNQNEFNSNVRTGLLDLQRNKADKSEIPTVPTNVSAFTNDAGYLTEHQDISNLATKTELDNKADKSEIPDTSNFATKNEIPNTSNFATKNDVNKKQDNLLFYRDYDNELGKMSARQTSENNWDIMNNSNHTIAVKNDEHEARINLNPDGISISADTVEINGENVSNFAKKDDIPTFKTINGNEITGSGNIVISGEGGAYDDSQVKQDINDLQNNKADKSEIPDTSNFATKDEIPVIPNFKTINGEEITGDGNIVISGGSGAGGGDVYKDQENTFTQAQKFPAGVFVNDPRNGQLHELFEILSNGYQAQQSTSQTLNNRQYEGEKIVWVEDLGQYVIQADENYDIMWTSLWNQTVSFTSIDNNFELFYKNTNIDETIHKVEIGGILNDYVTDVYVNVPKGGWADEWVQTTDMPIDGNYMAMQSVPDGYVCLMSTNQGKGDTQYSFTICGNTTLHIYQSAERKWDHIQINDVEYTEQYHVWFTVDVNEGDVIKFVKDGGADGDADTAWVYFENTISYATQNQWVQTDQVSLSYVYNGWYQDYIQEKINNIVPNYGYIQDAPIDGNLWVRQDGNWVVAPSGGSGSGGNAIVFKNERVYNANDWQTNGYCLTWGDGITVNLPDECQDLDRWGVLFTIMENPENHTGTQMYYPIDGTNIGRIFTRGFQRNVFADWHKLAFTDEIGEGGGTGSGSGSETTPDIGVSAHNVIIHNDLYLENGILSGFSDTNYAEFPFLVDLKDKQFEIKFKITTGYKVTGNQQNIFDSNFGLAFAIRDGQFVCAFSENGTSWHPEQVGGSCESDTTYWIKILGGINVTTYSVQLSTDDVNYNEIMNFAGYPPMPKRIIIGKDLTGNYPFRGSIDLNECSLEIQNQLVWTGMGDWRYIDRLDTDLSNISEEGVNKIKSLVSVPTDTITLTAVLEDGSTKTFQIYGTEV